MREWDIALSTKANEHDVTDAALAGGGSTGVPACTQMAMTGLLRLLAGDYNIVPTEFEIYEKHSFADNALLQPESRNAYARLLKQGWTGGLRVLYPETRFFINWSYVRNRPAMRAFALTIFLLSSDVAARLKSGGVDRDVRG